MIKTTTVYGYRRPNGTDSYPVSQDADAMEAVAGMAIMPGYAFVSKTITESESRVVGIPPSILKDALNNKYGKRAYADTDSLGEQKP
jgi:hypothetical protein